MSVICVENINKEFRRYVKQNSIVDNLFNRKYETKIAVKNMSFEIEKGECVAILGQNGAGKTTTMKILSGLLLPTNGKVEVLGFTPFEKKKAYKKNMTLLLGQKQQLWWDVSAQDNYHLIKDIYELSELEYNTNLQELIEMLDMKDIINNPIRTLSLGERMKCELAGALLHKPQVLFLDEPTIGLDLIAQNDVRKFIKRYSKENNATVVLTSHNMDDVEAVCERTIFIDQGKKYYDGTLNEFVKEYATDCVLNIECIRDILNFEWNRYGKVIKKEENKILLRVPKSERQTIRNKLERAIEGCNIMYEDLDASEIVRDFYERDK